MTLVMLGFMLSMLKNTKLNVLIGLVGVVLLGSAIFLARSQTTVQDRSYMSAMIPHHSIAILTSEHSEISDVRVCELAVKIIEAQRREIQEMDWLIEDIGTNGLRVPKPKQRTDEFRRSKAPATAAVPRPDDMKSFD